MSQLPDWARALGPSLFSGRIRTTPADFAVTEMLDVEFSGDGEHDWLRVEKTGANTHWVAEALARHANIHPRDVGYSGMKDRNAVTEQWFSVRRPSAGGTDWDTFDADGVRILEKSRHSRKLKRGTHRGNGFRLAVRGEDIASSEEEIAERLQLVRAGGVPNYFGEQRFGRNGANIELGRAVIAGRRVSRNKRSIGISAIRSFSFNESLSARVNEGTWNSLLPGDMANLDGTGSVFAVDEVTPELERRCADMDIHPCGTLPELPEVGVAAAFRPLRMGVNDFDWELDSDALWLEFTLGRGCFATAVLREIGTFC